MYICMYCFMLLNFIKPFSLHRSRSGKREENCSKLVKKLEISTVKSKRHPDDVALSQHFDILLGKNEEFILMEHKKFNLFF